MSPPAATSSTSQSPMSSWYSFSYSISSCLLMVVLGSWRRSYGSPLTRRRLRPPARLRSPSAWPRRSAVLRAHLRFVAPPPSVVPAPSAPLPSASLCAGWPLVRRWLDRPGLRLPALAPLVLHNRLMASLSPFTISSMILSMCNCVLRFNH